MIIGRFCFIFTRIAGRISAYPETQKQANPKKLSKNDKYYLFFEN